MKLYMNLRICSGCWQAWAGYVVGYELMTYILSVTVSKVLMHIYILETVKPFHFQQTIYVVLQNCDGQDYSDM